MQNKERDFRTMIDDRTENFCLNSMLFDGRGQIQNV